MNKLIRAGIISLLLTLMFGNIKAQESYKVSGEVTAKATGESIPFASIAIYDLNDKIVTGTTSDFDGNFEILDLIKGEYKIEISYVGFSRITLEQVRIDVDKSFVFEMEEDEYIFCCCGCYFIEHNPPLIDFENTTSGQTIVLADRFKR